MNKYSFYNFFNKDNVGKNLDRLPKNRFSAYFDILRLKFTSLVAVSAITSLFFIPLFVVSFIATLYIATPTPDIIAPYEVAFRLFSLKMLSALINIPLLVVGFIGLGGTFYLIKKMALQEPNIEIIKDFFTGVRVNIKESLLSGSILGLYLFIFISNMYFFPTIENLPSYISISFSVILALVFVLVLGLVLYIMAGASLYKLEFIKTIKNNFLLATILFPKNFVFILVSTVFLVSYLLIPYVLVQLGLVIVSSLFGFSHMALSYTLYSFSVFDRFINLDHEPSLVNKGLDKLEE